MTPPRSVEEAWALILEAPASLDRTGLTVDPHGRVTVRGEGGEGLPADVRTLLEIFLPLQLREAWVVGQLGQSLDGRIATESGHSHYINGPEDIRRLHGLRALADAVVVGAGTAAADDPRLTVRKLPGPDPVRVVLDPRGRLPGTLNLFSDGGPPTLWIRGEAAEFEGRGAGSGPGAGTGRGGPAPGGGDPADGAGGVTVVHLPLGPSGGGFSPEAVLEALEVRGLRRVLVEGGGRTVSAFLEAGLLDRLHICVAPLLIGSGRPGITLPVVPTLDRALRPRSRHFPLGRDVLFDLSFSRDG